MKKHKRSIQQELGLWLVIIGLTFVLVACYPNPQPAGLTPIPTMAPAATLTPLAAVAGSIETGAGGKGDAGIGAAIFFKNCSQCHGSQAEGNIGPALRNDNFVASGSDQDVANTIANGRNNGKMPAWLQANGGPLTSAEILNTVAFLRTLQGVPVLPTATPIPPEPTETPAPANAPTPEPAVPSNPGGPGPAANLTGDPNSGKPLFGKYCAACHGPQGLLGAPNPDSDDGSVPSLNPIDVTIVDQDIKKFAANIDVFIEHGSLPSGSAPWLSMPAFGDQKILLEQQIADIIAYVIQLNGGGK